MTRLNRVERAEYELSQLDLWFKLNRSAQGSKEWEENMERGIDLSEIVGDL